MINLLRMIERQEAVPARETAAEKPGRLEDENRDLEMEAELEREQQMLEFQSDVVTVLEEKKAQQAKRELIGEEEEDIEQMMAEIRGPSLLQQTKEYVSGFFRREKTPVDAEDEDIEELRKEISTPLSRLANNKYARALWMAGRIAGIAKGLEVGFDYVTAQEASIDTGVGYEMRLDHVEELEDGDTLEIDGETTTRREARLHIDNELTSVLQESLGTSQNFENITKIAGTSVETDEGLQRMVDVEKYTILYADSGIGNHYEAQLDAITETTPQEREQLSSVLSSAMLERADVPMGGQAAVAGEFYGENELRNSGFDSQEIQMTYDDIYEDARDLSLELIREASETGNEEMIGEIGSIVREFMDVSVDRVRIVNLAADELAGEIGAGSSAAGELFDVSGYAYDTGIDTRLTNVRYTLDAETGEEKRLGFDMVQGTIDIGTDITLAERYMLDQHEFEQALGDWTERLQEGADESDFLQSIDQQGDQWLESLADSMIDGAEKMNDDSLKSEWEARKGRIDALQEQDWEAFREAQLEEGRELKSAYDAELEAYSDYKAAESSKMAAERALTRAEHELEQTRDPAEREKLLADIDEYRRTAQETESVLPELDEAYMRAHDARKRLASDQ